MKKKTGTVLKIIVIVILAVMFLLAVAAAYFTIKGYKMYSGAVAETPIAKKVEEIRSMEHFTCFEELPEIYVDAVVSVEDKRFWKHDGVDFLAICRAVWKDITTLSFAEGGSTITQQLMKNQYFTQEKKLERKVAEAFAALALEKEYSKEDIFELYVNTIYFGSGYYGIYDAAQGYFGKEPSELNEYEAVMLAGLPNAPSAYSPDSNPELAAQRMNQVLERMVACGALSQEDADRISNQGLKQANG